MPKSDDYLQNVREGRVPGQFPQAVFGWKADVSDEATLWPGPEMLAPPFPITAAQMTVSSTDATDTLGNSGCQNVVVFYLTDTYEEGVAVADMNGQTGVQLIDSQTTAPANIFRVNRVLCGGEGGDGQNNGTVYIGTGSISSGEPDEIYGVVEPGVGWSRHGFFTVPLNRQGSLYNVMGSVEHNRFFIARFFTKMPTRCRILAGEYRVDERPLPPSDLSLSESFLPMTDVWVTVEADAGTATASMVQFILLVTPS